MKDQNAARFEMREGDFFIVPVQKWDESKHPRDKEGQFVEGFHGTTAGRLDSILQRGILVGHAGEVWPTISSREHVYLTSDLDDAQIWADQAAQKAAGPQGKPPVAILTIRIPKEYASEEWLTRDRHFATGAKQFRGNIHPSWIIGARVGTQTPEGVYEWREVPLKKAAQDGEIVYVVLVLHSRAEKSPGLGGITRKFDEAKHPRGDDGRFIEATQPRIFNRPSDVGEIKGWPGDPVRYGWIEEGRTTGRLLTGEPIPREQIPPKLYHVTTNAPAVESSGVLLGLLESGGLGGGQEKGVSFTSSKEDAVVIQRELRRAVRVARGEADITAIKEWAQQDELVAGLPEGALSEAVAYAMHGWDVNSKSSLGRTDPPNPPEEEERIRRSLVHDALNAYLQTREETAAKALGQKEWPYSVPILKNPILFGRQEHLAKLDVKNIQILEASSEDIPADALVTTGSDKFLHEVRVYADVPRRRKKAAREYVREPAGSPKGGEFAKTTGAIPEGWTAEQWTAWNTPQRQAKAAIMDAAGIGVVGVDDHPVAIRAAHEVASKLKEMRARGYEMPREVVVEVQGKSPSGEALTGTHTIIIRVPDHLPPEMTLDDAMKIRNDRQPEGVPVGINPWTNQPHSPGLPRFASPTFQDIVVHEMGHVLRRPTLHAPDITRRSSPADIALAAEAHEQFVKELAAVKHERLDRAANSISQYAHTNTDEFVAEAFTILYNGGTLPPDTLAVYDALRGGKIR